MSELPAWLTVEAPVVVYTPSGLRGSSAQRRKVDRIGKRDVVLDDGQRFNLRYLRRSSGSYGPTSYLAAPDDPTALRYLAETRKRRLIDKAEALVRAWRAGDDTAPTTLRDLLDNAPPTTT